MATDDLDAPLQGRRPARTARKAAVDTGNGSRSWRWALGGGVLAALLALNVTARLGETAIAAAPEISLPEPVVAATSPTAAPEARPAQQPAEPEVAVLYGDGTRQTEGRSDAGQSDDAPAQPAASGEGERQLSPGGAKIITIRDPSAVRVGQPPQVAHLPDDAALESGPFGDLPIRTEDGRRPMDIYARPWATSTGKRIAIVIGGLGLSQTGTARAIELLPPEVTLAFAPQGNSLNRWMQAARRKGHELLVQVPMEPFGYPNINPGPRTLRLASSAQTNLENLHWAMGQITNYTGIVNYLGGKFATDSEALAPILGDLAYRGLLLLNDGSANAQLGAHARSKGVPYGQAEIIVDSSQTPEAIAQRLADVETLANNQGYAIASGSALGVTVEQVAQWMNEAKKRGFEFVGVSGIVQTTGN